MPTQRPNILLLFTDLQRADTLDGATWTADRLSIPGYSDPTP